MRSRDTQSLDFNGLKQSKYTKNVYTKELCDLLYYKPLSRIIVVAELGHIDQTYMVTQYINDLIKQGKAVIIGVVKCSRLGCIVEAVTTNPEFFPKSNQLIMF